MHSKVHFNAPLRASVFRYGIESKEISLSGTISDSYSELSEARPVFEAITGIWATYSSI